MSVISAEEFHWGCAGTALAISGSGLAAAGIASSGTPEQIARWVPECFGSGDEIKLGAYAVTEPQAGSDVKSLKTTAKRDGDEWVLNGTKVFITNGGIADVHVVVATVDPELGTRGQASFVVGKDTPGLSQGKKESKLGIRASHTAEVVLDDCRIPVENLLGGEEKLQKKLERGRSGQKSRSGADALATFEMTRPLVGASALGIAQAAYEWTLEYLDGRSEGGTPLLQQQRIQQTLADVATEIEAARLLVQRASWMGRNGIPMTRRPGLDVEAQGRRRDDVGDDDADGPGRPLRLEHRVPAGEVVPRRQDLPAVRGHGGDPADGHLAHAGARIRGAPRLRRRSRREGDERRDARPPPVRRVPQGAGHRLAAPKTGATLEGKVRWGVAEGREQVRARAVGSCPRSWSRSRCRPGRRGGGDDLRRRLPRPAAKPLRRRSRQRSTRPRSRRRATACVVGPGRFEGPFHYLPGGAAAGSKSSARARRRC